MAAEINGVHINFEWCGHKEWQDPNDPVDSKTIQTIQIAVRGIHQNIQVSLPENVDPTKRSKLNFRCQHVKEIKIVEKLSLTMQQASDITIRIGTVLPSRFYNHRATPATISRSGLISPVTSSEISLQTILCQCPEELTLGHTYTLLLESNPPHAPTARLVEEGHNVVIAEALEEKKPVDRFRPQRKRTVKKIQSKHEAIKRRRSTVAELFPKEKVDAIIALSEELNVVVPKKFLTRARPQINQEKAPPKEKFIDFEAIDSSPDFIPEIPSPPIKLALDDLVALNESVLSSPEDFSFDNLKDLDEETLQELFVQIFTEYTNCEAKREKAKEENSPDLLKYFSAEMENLALLASIEEALAKLKEAELENSEDPQGPEIP